MLHKHICRMNIPCLPFKLGWWAYYTGLGAIISCPLFEGRKDAKTSYAL